MESQADSHGKIDERSLAFGRAIAARLHEHPELVVRARETLARWMSTASARALPDLQEWDRVLAANSVENAIPILTGTDERAIRLRQSNPFTGVLTRRERSEILKQFTSDDTAAA